jgi:hypothetical protein
VYGTAMHEVERELMEWQSKQEDTGCCGNEKAGSNRETMKLM